MIDPFQELQKLQEEIARLKRVRDDALMEVEKAKQGVNELQKPTTANSQQHSQSTGTNPLPHYSDKSYWTERYRSNESNQSSVVSSPTYEWYASYSTLTPLIAASLQRSADPQHTQILLPGCGNSDLGEQLSISYPEKSIVAIDFDKNVLQSMRKRAKSRSLENISYEEGDVLDLRSHRAASFDLILDKGTLDAIASGGQDGKEDSQKLESQSSKVGRYCLEMWRVLRIGGQFVVVTTMSPSIFETLVVAPIESACIKPGEEEDSHGSDWRSGCIIAPLKTEAGGAIFYYSLSKHRNVLSQKEFLASAFAQALQEAREEDEDQWMMMEKEAMEAAAADSQKLTGPLECIFSITEAEKIEFFAGVLPTASVDLIVQEDASVFVSGGVIRVNYRFTSSSRDIAGDGWREDDFIRLVCTGHDNHNKSNSHTYQYASNDQLSETIYYLDLPSSLYQSQDGQQWVFEGNISIPLPSYAGLFVLAYTRRLPRDFQSSASIQQQTRSSSYVELAVTAPFSIPCSIYEGHPDQLPRPVTVPGRRSLKPVARFNQPYILKVDNMNHIQALHIDLSWATPVFVDMNRLNVWVTKSSPQMMSTTGDGGGSVLFQLLLEVDQIFSADPEGGEERHYAEKVVTEHYEVMIGEDQWLTGRHAAQGESYCFYWNQAICEVKDSSLVHIRLPYQIEKQKANAVDRKKIHSIDPNNLAELVHINLHCGFCEQKIVDYSSLTQFHLLPSGLFDESMHEFFCCENVDHLSLRVEDMEVNSNSFHCGPVFALLSSSSVIKNTCELDCKAGQGLSDIFTAMGSALATSPLDKLPQVDQPKKRMDFLRRRCESLLGEATLSANSAEENTPANNEGSNDDTSLDISEASQIRLYWHRVHLDDCSERSLQTLHSQDPSWRWMQTTTSIDQVFARTCQYLFEKFNAVVCCVYLLDESTFQQSLQNNRLEMFLVRILSCSHQMAVVDGSDRVGNEIANSHALLRECVKLGCYLETDASVRLRGTEVRLPLEREDYVEFVIACY
eukprot:scaffold2602_cov177-Ochromonas_danica.AAC.19